MATPEVLLVILRVPRRPLVAAAAMLPLLACAACESYEPRPLDVDGWVQRIAAERNAAAAATIPAQLTLRDAAALMLERNPRVVAARRDYDAQAAVAGVATPLSNPTLTAGPVLFGGGASGSSTTLEAALSWALPWFGVRGLRDDLHAVEARAAFAHAVSTCRAEYVALRADFAALALAARSVQVRQELAAATRASVELMRSRARAGRGDALDVRLLEVEAAKEDDALRVARERVVQLRGRVAERCGTSLAAVGVPGRATLPSLSAEPPALDELTARLADVPALQTLRAAYEVSERRLRLEVARQYPDLLLDPSYELEPDDASRIALGIGFELPLFDRNQQAIGRARAERDGARDRWVAELRRRAAATERALDVLTLRRERLRSLRDTLQPSIEQIGDAVRRLVEAGTIDGVRLLEVARTTVSARLDLLEAERATYEAWNDLERALDAPLLVFPLDPREGTAPDDEDTGPDDRAPDDRAPDDSAPDEREEDR